MLHRLAPARTDALLKRYSSRYSQGGKRSADRAYRITSQRCGVSARALAATLRREFPLGDGRTLEVIWTHTEPRTALRQRIMRIEGVHVDDGVYSSGVDRTRV